MSTYRLGGWIIPDEEAIAWGARLSGKPVEDVTFDYAAMKILKHLSRFGVTLAAVTYPKDVDVLMVLTRCQPHAGWRKGDDPTKLKQFEMGKHEAKVLKVLKFEGIKETEFVTSHGRL